MQKIKAFCKKHKTAIIITVSVVGGIALGIGGVYLFNGIRHKTQSVCLSKDVVSIDPAFYETLDEGFEAFKKLREKTNHAVLFDSYGHSFGVFDEAVLLGEKGPANGRWD